MVYFSALQSISPKTKKKQTVNRKAIIGIVIFCVLLLLGYFTLFKPAAALTASTKELVSHGKNLKIAAAEQNLKKISEEIVLSKSILSQTSAQYSYFRFLSYIPILRTYYQDGERLLRAGAHGLVGAEIIVEGIKPFSDVLGFQENADEADLAAEDKLAYLVGVMPQIVTVFDSALEELNTLSVELSAIDPNRYPEKVGNNEIRSSLQLANSLVSKADKTVNDLRPLFTLLPEALGRNEVKRYLLLFQNDKELRPTGGFITAYALIQFDKGKFTIIKSEDIYNIDTGSTYLPIPSPITQYLKVSGYFLRDTNFSPDFKTSMQDFEVYYEKLNDMPEIDGIVALDTEFVRTFLEILGPIHLEKYDETFEASNVVHELELYSEKILQGSGRKDLLGDLMQEMVKRAFSVNKEKWKPMMETAIFEAREKHLLFYLHDSELQALVEKNNLAGRITETEGDYLHINDANLGGLKSDMYVQRSVRLNVDINSEGIVRNELGITYTNPEPFDGWLNAKTRDYVRVYVPNGSTFVSSSGGTIIPAGVGEDLGKTVFTNFIQVYPANMPYPNTETITFIYELPEKVTGDTYSMLIQKQPGLGEPEYIVDVNGIVKTFKLDSDKTLTFDLR